MEELQIQINDENYKCRCGQYVGFELFRRGTVCSMCGTKVMYRSKRLPEYVEVDDFVDCVYLKQGVISTIMNQSKFNFAHLRIFELSENVMIYHMDKFYLIKNRMPKLNENGSINIAKTYDYIRSKHFRVLKPTQQSVVIANNSEVSDRNYIFEID